MIVPEVRPNERHSKDTHKLSTRFLSPSHSKAAGTPHLSPKRQSSSLPHDTYARAFEHVQQEEEEEAPPDDLSDIYGDPAKLLQYRRAAAMRMEEEGD